VETGKQSGPHDKLLLPGGKSIAEVSSTELARILAGVPGVSASNGRSLNLENYEKHLDSIRTAAADKAVADWLAGH